MNKPSQKKWKKIYKTLELPHLRFKVHFMDMKYLKGIEILGIGYTCISGDFEATVFIQDIEKSAKQKSAIPFIAHELMHVIQIICDKFQMRIENEQEHTAYIMFYLLDELTR